MAQFIRMTTHLVAQRAGTAVEFLQVAHERLEFIRRESGDSAEAQVAASSAINAGIAAVDAICGKVLGERANDHDHHGAVVLLERVKPSGMQLARRLRSLLAEKSQLQYGGYCTAAVALTMTRDAEKLVEAMAAYEI